MTNRNQLSLSFLAVALLLIAAGVALGSSLSIYLGLVLAALVVRYRKKPAAWEYFCFVALALATGAWAISTRSEISPLLGATPLMLSYLFDYLDERRLKQAVAPETALSTGASHGGGPAEPGTPPNGSPATRAGNSGVAECPPSVKRHENSAL